MEPRGVLGLVMLVHSKGMAFRAILGSRTLQKDIDLEKTGSKNVLTVLQQLDVVWLIANLRCVGQDLVELASLRESSNNFAGNICTQVDAESKVQVVWSNDIAQLLRAVKLVFLHPFLQKVLSVLCKNGSDKFESFVLVECSLIQEHAKVLENNRQLSCLCGNSLESLDGLWGSEEASRRVRSNLCGFCIIALLQ